MHEVRATRTADGVRLQCHACRRSEAFLGHEFDRLNDFIDAHRPCAEGTGSRA